jgi:hypothetical protein
MKAEKEQKRHTLNQAPVQSKETPHSLSKQAPTISQEILTKEEPDLFLYFFSTRPHEARDKTELQVRILRRQMRG